MSTIPDSQLALSRSYRYRGTTVLPVGRLVAFGDHPGECLPTNAADHRPLLGLTQTIGFPGRAVSVLRFGVGLAEAEAPFEAGDPLVVSEGGRVALSHPAVYPLRLSPDIVIAEFLIHHPRTTACLYTIFIVYTEDNLVLELEGSSLFLRGREEEITPEAIRNLISQDDMLRSRFSILDAGLIHRHTPIPNQHSICANTLSIQPVIAIAEETAHSAGDRCRILLIPNLGY